MISAAHQLAAWISGWPRNWWLDAVMFIIAIAWFAFCHRQTRKNGLTNGGAITNPIKSESHQPNASLETHTARGPKELFEEVQNARPFAREEMKNTLVGVSVTWRLVLISANPLNDGDRLLVFMEKVSDLMPLVSAILPASKAQLVRLA